MSDTSENKDRNEPVGKNGISPDESTAISNSTNQEESKVEQAPAEPAKAEPQKQEPVNETVIPHIGSNTPLNDKDDEEDEKQEQSTQSSQGSPSVKSGNNKSKDTLKKVLLVILLIVLIVLGVLFFLYQKGYIGQEQFDSANDYQNTPTSTSLTSSNQLSRVPHVEIQRQEPKVEVVEEPKVVEKELPLPIPAAVAVDAKGNPLPTLEELKFAAPMMGNAGSANQSSGGGGGGNASYATASPMPAAGTTGMGGGDSGGTKSLGDMLEPVHTPSKNARVIKEQSLTLSKGTVIECILETRVDTTVPGMTSCVVPRNIYSMDGRTLLVEKGTKAIGEYQGAVQNGLARIFMLWTELRTPHGVSIALNSPTTDNLGGAGMGGYVDYHWWQRFGNALLFSMVSDGFQYVVNNATLKNNTGDVTYNNTTDSVDEIIQEAMAQSGNIPPTLVKNQGEKVAIFVARDLNFSNVYSLSK